MSHAHPLRVVRCLVCSSHARAVTGECANCGSYLCPTVSACQVAQGNRDAPQVWRYRRRFRFRTPFIARAETWCGRIASSISDTRWQSVLAMPPHCVAR